MRGLLISNSALMTKFHLLNLTGHCVRRNRGRQDVPSTSKAAGEAASRDGDEPQRGRRQQRRRRRVQTSAAAAAAEAPPPQATWIGAIGSTR